MSFLWLRGEYGYFLTNHWQTEVLQWSTKTPLINKRQKRVSEKRFQHWLTDFWGKINQTLDNCGVWALCFYWVSLIVVFLCREQERKHQSRLCWWSVCWIHSVRAQARGHVINRGTPVYVNISSVPVKKVSRTSLERCKGE